jgi:hypothetical protein
MHSKKEKRACQRINTPDLSGSVELKESVKTINIVNANKEGVCVEGAGFPVGSVVRLVIDPLEDTDNISLYCKVVWASQDYDTTGKSGLLFLNTNKILFKNDLISFNKLIDSARKRAQQ